MTSATNLAVFLPFLPEGSFLARLLGMVDLFIDLVGGGPVDRRRGRLRARRPAPSRRSLFGVYGVIAVAIAAFMAAGS